MTQITLVENSTYSISADEKSGCISSFKLYGRELLDVGRPGAELHVNQLPLELRVARHTWTHIDDYPQCQAGPAVNEMHACRFLSHYTGWGIDVTRSIRAVGEARVNLCYTVQRTKVRTLYDVPGPGWGAIEAPLTIESVTAGVLNWRLFGEDTRMLQFASGSAGPAQHVGYSFGPVEQVKAECNTWFRRQYCGVLGFPGCIFSDARTGHWLAVMCSRPAIAYNLNHEAAGAGTAFDFLPVGELRMHASVVLPNITFRAGRTEESMRRFLAGHISAWIEEPASWFAKTTWYNMGCTAEAFASWADMRDAAVALTENGACSGLELIFPQRNLAFGGLSCNSIAPTEDLGSRADFERAVRDLKARGLRLLVWLPTAGMGMDRDADPDWFLRGTDGDTLPTWGLPHVPHILGINWHHPGFQAYYKRWLDYYVGKLGFDGVLLDCAGFSFPFDYTPRPFMRYASDPMLSQIVARELIRSHLDTLNPDAVMVLEGACLEAPGNVILMGCNTPSADGLGARDLLLKAREWGGKRIYVNSGIEADLAAGMPAIVPGGNDAEHGQGGANWRESYARAGQDPFNRLLTSMVSEKGTGAATSAGFGISVLGDIVVVPEPRIQGLPAAALVPPAPGRPDQQGIRVQLPGNPVALRSLLSERTLVPDDDGYFHFHERDIYQMRPAK